MCVTTLILFGTVYWIQDGIYPRRALYQQSYIPSPFLSYSFVCETVLHRSPCWPQIHISSLGSAYQLLGLYIWLLSPWRDGSAVMNTWYSYRRLAQFPAPTLSCTQPPSSRDSNAIFWPLKVPGHTCAQTYKQAHTQTHTKSNSGLVVYLKSPPYPGMYEISK